jgi:hypothetical protein
MPKSDAVKELNANISGKILKGPYNSIEEQNRDIHAYLVNTRMRKIHQFKEKAKQPIKVPPVYTLKGLKSEKRKLKDVQRVRKAFRSGLKKLHPTSAIEDAYYDSKIAYKDKELKAYKDAIGTKKALAIRERLIKKREKQKKNK